MTNPLDNPIGYLQEFCQKYRPGSFPSYEPVGVTGPDHCKKFSLKCEYEGLEVIGIGQQKKHAKFEAARLMYELLKQNNYFDKFNDKVKSENLQDTETSFSGNSQNLSRNPISALQEYCQASSLELPNYFETSTATAGFVCGCSVQDHKTYGHGTTKKCAKTEAAFKMCIELSIIVPMKKDCKSEVDENEYEDVQGSNTKNAISMLQEKCSKSQKLSVPEYEDKGCIMGLFVIVCQVRSFSAEGKDTTKKGAKLLAAHKVLEMILASESEKTGIPHQPLTQSIKSTTCSLEEFNLDSDEEDVEKKSKDHKSVLSMSKQLDSLTLDDAGAVGHNVEVAVDDAGAAGHNDEAAVDDARAVGDNAEAATEVKVESDHLIVNGMSQENYINSDCSKDNVNDIPPSKNGNQVNFEECSLPKEE